MQRPHGERVLHLHVQLGQHQSRCCWSGTGREGSKCGAAWVLTIGHVDQPPHCSSTQFLLRSAEATEGANCSDNSRTRAIGLAQRSAKLLQVVVEAGNRLDAGLPHSVSTQRRNV